MRSFVLVLLLAACGKSSDSSSSSGAPGDGLPPECADFKAAIAKIQTCDKLPADQRARIQQDYDKTYAGWMALSPNGRSKLGRACKVGTDAYLNASVKKTCGW